MKGTMDRMRGRGGEGGKRAEIYTYTSEDDVFGMNWSNRSDKKWRLAVGSYKEDTDNYVEIITLEDEAGEFRSDPALRFYHKFPPTKIMFMPERMVQTSAKDLLITSADYLRIFSIGEDAVDSEATLNNNKQETCSPLTSFDWNEHSTNRVGTSSLDTTCTIWDIEKMCVETQLIAHDREVNDFAWGGAGVFASVSSDGSVRVFDLRDKEHSTIIFEAPSPMQPLLRLGWNKQDPRYMATIIMDASQVFILDIRFPATPVAELQRHQECVNALAWAPHSSAHICTAGEDAQALIWDLGQMSNSEPNPDPILAYSAGCAVNQLQWSALQTDWVAICFGNKTQCLRV